MGKSTLLRHILPEGMRYITLDDYQLAEVAKGDPMGFLDAYEGPLCIDEIQHAPELFRAIKMKVDANRQPGMYWEPRSSLFLGKDSVGAGARGCPVSGRPNVSSLT